MKKPKSIPCTDVEYAAWKHDMIFAMAESMWWAFEHGARDYTSCPLFMAQCQARGHERFLLPGANDDAIAVRAAAEAIFERRRVQSAPPALALLKEPTDET